MFPGKLQEKPEKLVVFTVEPFSHLCTMITLKYCFRAVEYWPLMTSHFSNVLNVMAYLSTQYTNLILFDCML